ncbi:MAG TPA: hypothetical protein VFF15_07245 [Flavobacteriaceae bacterium]|nr:hypothetical protein [Flavobacteriaceae bacterium]
MKALKVTFLALAVSALFVSCVKEDLNEDDQLLDAQIEVLNTEIQVTLDTGGGNNEQ